MFCIYCGKNIADDSSFCPYCGRNQEIKSIMHCTTCGSAIEGDSSFCPYCGNKLHHTTTTLDSIKWKFPQFNYASIIKNRFFIWFILWFFVNCILLYKSGDAYSDYFNITNVRPDHWLVSDSDKGIYPEDWFYPFRNIFTGIVGQDPIYVYDMSEFIIYVFIIPLVLSFMIYKRNSFFKTDKAANIFYWIIWYVLLWLLILFPMGLLGLDFLGCFFVIGGAITAIYACHKIRMRCAK